MARAQTTGDEAAAPEIAGPGNDSHLTQLLYGGGVAFTNSAGVPWTAAYVDTIGDPTCDLRSNIAAEARAKITYERLINCTDDPGLREALGFLMTREVSHQQSFEKALYSIQPSFPPGKLPPMKEFESVYFNMSTGEGDARGPWNKEPTFEFRDAETAVDGGDGLPQVKVGKEDAALLAQAAARLKSDTSLDPTTGAMLGADGNAARAQARKDPQKAQPGTPPRH